MFSLLQPIDVVCHFQQQNKTHNALLVYFCSCGVLLQRLPPVDVAAPADGHPGLRWNTLLLHGGEDAQLQCRCAGTLETFFITIVLLDRCLLGGNEAVKKTSLSFMS